MNELWLELIGYAVTDSSEEHAQASNFVLLYQDDTNKLADKYSLEEHIFLMECHDIMILAEVHDVALCPAVGSFPSIVIGHHV